MANFIHNNTDLNISISTNIALGSDTFNWAFDGLCIDQSFKITIPPTPAPTTPAIGPTKEPIRTPTQTPTATSTHPASSRPTTAPITTNPTEIPSQTNPAPTIVLNINLQKIALTLEIEYYTTTIINETESFYDFVVLNETKFTNIIRRNIYNHYADVATENDIVLVFGNIQIISSTLQSMTMETIHNITNYNSEISDLLYY
eukprot:503718_1